MLHIYFSASIKEGTSWRKWRAPSFSGSCACCLARNMPVLINESSLVTFAGSLLPKWMYHISSKLSHKQKWVLPCFTRLAKLSEREVSPLLMRALCRVLTLLGLWPCDKALKCPAENMPGGISGNHRFLSQQIHSILNHTRKQKITSFHWSQWTLSIFYTHTNLGAEFDPVNKKTLTFIRAEGNAGFLQWSIFRVLLAYFVSSSCIMHLNNKQ